MDLNQEFLDRCKLHKTLVDRMKAAYKPTLREYVKDEKKSDDENTVTEEYLRLVFFISKIRNIFITFQQSLEDLTKKKEVKMPRTSEGWHLFCSLNKDMVGGAKESLMNVVNFPKFKWLRSISEIPSNTEFTYLGHVDSVDLEEELKKFDPLFKKYIGLVLKVSSVGSEQEISKLVHSTILD